MGLETAENGFLAQPPATQVPSLEELEQAKGPKEKKPIDPEKRARQAKKAAVRRRLNELQKAKDVEELESMFMEGKAGTHPVTTAKKPASPPPPPAPVAAAPAIPARQLVELVWSTYQELTKKSADLSINDEQRTALVSAWTPLAEKYEHFLQDGPEVVAIGTTLAVFAPRLISKLNRGKLVKVADAAAEQAA